MAVDCSIVFPLLNESENIDNSYNVITDILKKKSVSYEIIYVDDGSTDNSVELIKNLCKKDKNVKLVSFSRNFGQQPAILAGLKNSKGKFAINMDIDLEEDPSVVSDMIDAWREGYEVVTVERKKRKEGLFKRLTAWAYYRVLRFFGVKNTKELADFRLLDRKVIDALIDNTGDNIYMKHQVNWVGFKSKTIEAVRNKRQFGQTKYNFKKMLKAASKGMVSETEAPLYLSFKLSVMFGFLSIATLVTFVVLTILRIYFSMSFWLIPIILFCTATLLFVLGFVGMYLGFTLNEVRGRKPYIIKEKVNIDEK